MSSTPPAQRALDDLITDLQIERHKLRHLVESLQALLPQWQEPSGQSERIDAAALRLQSLYTGMERCFGQITRVFNGGPPEGHDWHRRLLERMTLDTEQRPALLDPQARDGLAELLRFRHVVRHLYAYELRSDQVHRLVLQATELWPRLEGQLLGFEAWLRELIGAKHSVTR